MKDRILAYLRAGYPGVALVTHEELRAEMEIKTAADEAKFKIFTWSVCSGLVEVLNAQQGQTHAGTEDPVPMLTKVDELESAAVVILHDFHTLLAEPNPTICRKLRESLRQARTKNVCIILVGCRVLLPPEVEKEIVVLDFTLPNRAELGVVLDTMRDSNKLEPFKKGPLRDAVLDAASGLTTVEAESAFALAHIEAPKDQHRAPAIVAREKASTVKKNGLLEIVDARVDLNDIGGLQELKAWLLKRQRAFGPEAQKYGLPQPKGFLLTGIPGCGKSLTAKATAKILGVPLLKLDAGKLFGSLVGQSEFNLRTALATAETVAPCVLWIDELEKAFAGTRSSGATDGGTTARVFGTYLQWMQEKTAPVFVVATANDISSLPPELLRKGRFDENWFVDLPNEAERQDIWRIQIAHHKRKPGDFNLPELAKATPDFTGAEIESLFVESLFHAFEENREPDMELLLKLTKAAVPLSRMMSAEIYGLRKWADGRARRATLSDEKPGAGGSRKFVAVVVTPPSTTAGPN